MLSPINPAHCRFVKCQQSAPHAKTALSIWGALLSAVCRPNLLRAARGCKDDVDDSLIYPRIAPAAALDAAAGARLGLGADGLATLLARMLGIVRREKT